LDATELSEKESMFQWETKTLQSLVRREGQIQAAADKQNLIVELNVALKGPFPLVGESDMSREGEMSRTK
jgi:hypothetical protein